MSVIIGSYTFDFAARSVEHGNRFRRGMTLVEVLIALVVFSLVVLGAVGLTIFSLRTMDEIRTVSQVERILTNEMETMRMRGWFDRTVTDAATGAPLTLYGLKTLGTCRLNNGTSSTSLTGVSNDTETPVSSSVTALGGGNYSAATTTYSFKPFAVYGQRNSASTGAATLGKEIDTGSTLVLRNPDGYTLARTVTLRRSSDGAGGAAVSDVDYAEITVSAFWRDRRGDHTRSFSETLSKNGLSDFYYRALPQ